MGIAYVDFRLLHTAIAAGNSGPKLETPEQFETYIEGIRVRAEKFNRAVLALVIAAADRMAPAESHWNRFRRRGARRRISEYHDQLLALMPPDQRPSSLRCYRTSRGSGVRIP